MARPEFNKVDRAAPKTKKDGGGIKKTSGGRVTRSVSNRLQEVLDARFEANTRSRLLSLPGELRNKIYEYAIGGYEVVFFRSRHTGEDTTKASPCDSDVEFMEDVWNKIFALGHTCRQIHQETKPLPYRLNRFIIPVRDEEGPFLGSMTPYMKQEIATVAFMTAILPPHWGEDSIPEELYACEGLTTIISTGMLMSHHSALVEEFAKKKGCKHVVEYEIGCDYANGYSMSSYKYTYGKWWSLY